MANNGCFTVDLIYFTWDLRDSSKAGVVAWHGVCPDFDPAHHGTQRCTGGHPSGVPAQPDLWDLNTGTSDSDLQSMLGM